ncbi:MAG: hypothetical protein ACOH2A_11485 [Sphingobacteriaceae bacterium]
MMITQMGIMMVLAGIAVQDLKSRSVYAFWFPALLLLFACEQLSHQSILQIAKPVLINLAFLLLQFLLLSLYFSAKNRKWVNITSGLLGFGDIFFLVCIAFFLSVLNFVLFYVLSLLLILLCWLIWMWLPGAKNRHIPLAGLQAILFGLVFIVDWFLPMIDLTRDNWLLEF